MLTVRPARLRPVLAAAAIAVAAAGCGRTEHAGPTRTLNVALTEYRINPAAATVPSGVVTFLVHNYGRLTHNLVVDQSQKFQGSTAAIAPGGEASVQLVLAPGTYQLASTILNDADLGLRATLHVT